eukprot:TRINITY_DN34434_c0_g1_i1.p1 TRINITY_DN34434_c0_g1~~TRINITY_DN34434_c0_g1_i1.p1  ORF type:complete len:1118 (+),score=82.61 TRINITY_DN34434_c0_g1_i1:403-3354(+)
MKTNFDSRPKSLDCPPGFYCKGGHEPPRSCHSGDHCGGGTAYDNRRCPTGFFCPTPMVPQQVCFDGTQCQEGMVSPDLCDPGYFCADGKHTECPEGSYCPEGSAFPVRCHFGQYCPRASHAPRPFFGIVLLLVGVFVFAVIPIELYIKLVQRGLFVIFACVVAIGPTWMLDTGIAWFLTVVTTVTAANWALLRFALCHQYMYGFLLVCTVFAGLVASWLVNPPLSLLWGSMVLLSTWYWLIAQPNVLLVVIGRTLLHANLSCLAIAYIFFDPVFVLCVGGIVLFVAFGLVASSVWDGHFNVFSGDRLRFAAFSNDIEISEIRRPSTESTASSATLPMADAKSPQVSASCPAASSVSFSLTNVNFDLDTGNRLLSNISLNIAESRRVAIMGSSGSGKSTLLSVLSGQASYGFVTGEALVSGNPIEAFGAFRSSMGFVPQDDVLLAELTVMENILYQASLRLPPISRDEVEAHVQQVLVDLNLTDIQGSRVGSPERRGVSGGQRKRVSVAMELVSQPLLLFADEPTTGLDSSTAHDIVHCMNSAASRLCTTVIAVVHQPRYKTLCLFDDLILLVPGGRIVYAGPTEKVVSHFVDRMGVQFHPRLNPLDVLLDNLHQSADSFVDDWQRHAVSTRMFADQPIERSLVVRERLTFFQSLLLCMDRSMRLTIRDRPRILMGCFIVTVLTYLSSVLFPYYRVDGFLLQSLLALLGLMLTQSIMATRLFAEDMLMTKREALVGVSTLAYAFARDLTALVEVTVVAAVFSAVYGGVSGILASLPQLIAASWVFVYCVFGFGYLFSVLFPPGIADMAATFFTFIAFCLSGGIPPFLPTIASSIGGRGWMLAALSPIRWIIGYFWTNEVGCVPPLMLKLSSPYLKRIGYDVSYRIQTSSGDVDSPSSYATAWAVGDGWVFSVTQPLLLGILIRCLAFAMLQVNVSIHKAVWAGLGTQSNRGRSKLATDLMLLVTGSLLVLAFVVEIKIFGMIRL